MLPVLHTDAAGIDIGAEEVFVAVSSGPFDGVGAIVRYIYSRPIRVGRLATVLQSTDVRNGIHECLLNSRSSNPRNT